MSDDGQNKGESTNEVDSPTPNTLLPTQIKVPIIHENSRDITAENNEIISCKNNLQQENNQSSYSDKSNHDQEYETKVPTTITTNTITTNENENYDNNVLQLTKVPTTTSTNSEDTVPNLNPYNSCDNNSSMLITNNDNSQQQQQTENFNQQQQRQQILTTENNANNTPANIDPAILQRSGNQQTDVEKFGGKIVYNPDGSAYIIEDGDLSEEEALPLPKQEGSITEKQDQEGGTPGEGGETPSYPLIANAIYVTRSAAYYNALYGQAYAKILREKMTIPEAPIVHSYKVYSLRHDLSNREESQNEPPLVEYSTVPVKPILMCFVCKLSFGFATSFVNHCTGEHNVSLSDKERSILDAKNSSAILQLVGKDKDPVVSFLEPVVKKVPSGPGSIPASVATPAPPLMDTLKTPDQILSPNAIQGLLSAALTQQQKFPESLAPGKTRIYFLFYPMCMFSLTKKHYDVTFFFVK